jgi:hypothetical protein
LNSLINKSQFHRSIIIDHLQTTYRFTANIACIYIYFEYRDRRRQDLANLLSSLLAQLVRSGDIISPDVKEIHQAWKRKGMYPSPDEYLRMLKSQAESFSKVFIVIDALDECLNDPETNTMNDFLKALHQLPQKVHVLFTSRHNTSIGQKIKVDRKLEIVAKKDDLRRYVENRINSFEHLKLLVNKRVKQDECFLDKVLDAIAARSQGM